MYLFPVTFICLHLCQNTLTINIYIYILQKFAQLASNIHLNSTRWWKLFYWSMVCAPCFVPMSGNRMEVHL